jgi:hypothetical protein
VAWSVGGLETTGFAATLTLGAWLALRCWEPQEPDVTFHATRTAWWAGVAFATSGLARPEGYVAGLLAAALMVRSRPDLAWRLLLPCALAGGGWLLFRLVYYGDWLPNVAYAKGAGVSWDRRLSGSWSYLVTNAVHVLPALVAAVLGIVRAPACGRILAFALPVLAGILVAGGDHMPYARLWAPVVPLLAVAIAQVRHTSNGSSPTIGRLIAASAIVAAAIPHVAFMSKPVPRDFAATVGAPVGRFLEQNLAGGSWVAVGTAGSTPFHAPSINFIDTMGLNDRTIARAPVGPVVTRLQQHSGHWKGDGAYVLSRRPDVIVLGPAEGYLGDPATAS